jgi:hypothetical protein
MFIHLVFQEADHLSCNCIDLYSITVYAIYKLGLKICKKAEVIQCQPDPCGALQYQKLKPAIILALFVVLHLVITNAIDVSIFTL